MVGEGVVITESVLLGSAELGGNEVSGDTANIRGRVGDHHSVLNVQTLDLAESAGVSAVLGDERVTTVILELVSTILSGPKKLPLPMR